MKRTTRAEWAEFWASSVPGIDWHYTLAHKTTAVERRFFPAFCKRSKRDLLASTAEHLVYLFVGFLAAKLLNPLVALTIGALVIFTIVPAEFLAYHHFLKLFKNLKPRQLALCAAWNILNVSLYWIIGVAAATFA